MSSLHSKPASTSLLPLALLVTLGLGAACSSDEKSSAAPGGGGSSGADTADSSAGGANAGGSNAGGGGTGGRNAGGTGTGGAAGNDAGTDAATGGAPPDDATTDAPVPSGDCSLTFSNNTSNVAASTPITAGCRIEQFGGGDAGKLQWNFGAGDSVSGTTRSFNVDWFDVTTPAGTALAIQDGFDITAGTGINVSYMDLPSGVFDTYSWSADTGTVKLLSISGSTYTIEVTAAHFAPTPDPFNSNKATGSFELNGTVTGTLP